MYAALRRITSLSGLFLTCHFTKSSIRANEKAEHDEYNQLLRNSAFQLIENCQISKNKLKVMFLNLWLLNKHALDIWPYKYDQKLCVNDVINLTEHKLKWISQFRIFFHVCLTVKCISIIVIITKLLHMDIKLQFHVHPNLSMKDFQFAKF